MYLLRRDYAGADGCYRQLTTGQDKTMRSQGRTSLANIPTYQGKFDHALQVLDDGLAADRIEQAEGRWSAHKHLSKAFIYEEKNNLNLALREMESYMEIYSRIDPDEKVAGRPNYARLLALNKEFDRASQVAETVRSAIDTSRVFLYWWVLGCIELARGNLEVSLADFQKAAKNVPDFAQHYMLATAYLEAGRLGEAVTEFEKVLSRYDSDRASLPIWAVKAYYLLGIAYDKSGWTDKAIEKYEEFLDIWKDADPRLKEVGDAKARLARLKGKS